MSYNGSGVFNINTSGQPVVTGTVISSTAFNALTADLATGLTTALTKDGQTTPTANIPMGGFKITGIAAATTLGDALSYGRAATVSTLTNSALTSGRVTFASTSGLLADSANLLWDGTTFGVTGRLYNGSASTFGASTWAMSLGNGGASANYFKANDTYWQNAAGTQTMTLNSSGSLGIGTSSPGTALHVSAAFQNQLRIQETGGTFFDIAVGARFDLRNAAGTTIVSIAQSGSPVGTQLNIDSSGNVGIGVTSPACILDISGAAGGQIKFPATQNASSDANTLDDYEEGTWTPTVVPQTGSLTAYTATAIYTKIGRQVFLQGKITITTAGTATGVAAIGAIPFQTGVTYIPTGTATETATTGANYAIYLNTANTTGVISSQNGLSGITWVNGYIYHFNITYST